MKTTTTTLLGEVLPEFDVEVFSGWLRRDFVRKIARNSKGLAARRRIPRPPRRRYSRCKQVEALVVRRLSPGGLQFSPFGSPGMTKTMIRAAWHMTTVAFLTVGSALVLSGSVLHGDTARGIGLVAAGESTGFAALAVGSAFAQAPRALFLHPAPALLTAVAVLARWGNSSIPFSKKLV
jgi:hypothetical protein